ncbi:MAG: hypothetical protein AAFV96_05725 [Pseudomonadota bacterium]
MSSTVFIVIGLIWFVLGAIFLKDYLIGERRVQRKRGAPTLRKED